LRLEGDSLCCTGSCKWLCEKFKKKKLKEGKRRVFFFCFELALLFKAGSEEKRKAMVCCWVGISVVVVMLLGGKGKLVTGGADDKALVDLLPE
jgi:hypothetical protein